MASAAVTASPLPAAGFRVVFMDPERGEQSRLLDEVGQYPFELAAQVRSFPSFRGQRNNTGQWWVATTRRLVGFESWLERDHVIRLDFDPGVDGLASQPFWLSWDDGARGRRHAPDYFARLADGTGLVIDCRPEGRIKPRDAAAFAATERACAEVGWRYELAHELDPVRMANIRWLTGYRYSRCRNDIIAREALRLAAEPHRIEDLAQRLGDPLGTLPVIFHLLWSHELETNLSLLLNETSMIATPLSGTEGGEAHGASPTAR